MKKCNIVIKFSKLTNWSWTNYENSLCKQNYKKKNIYDLQGRTIKKLNKQTLLRENETKTIELLLGFFPLVTFRNSYLRKTKQKNSHNTLKSIFEDDTKKVSPQNSFHYINKTIKKHLTFTLMTWWRPISIIQCLPEIPWNKTVNYRSYHAMQCQSHCRSLRIKYSGCNREGWPYQFSH